MAFIWYTLHDKEFNFWIRKKIIMSYELFPSNQQTHHCIFLDINVFRLLKREPIFWNNFFEFFDNEDRRFFEDIELIFTWSQLLEDINLGIIIKDKIKKNPLYKVIIKPFQDTNIDTINDSLDNFYNGACEIVSRIPELQPNKLIKLIDKSTISFAHSQAKILVEQTLIKAKNFIQESDYNYMEDLSHEIAWAFLTSYDFINPQSSKQWNNRKSYFDSLINLWHKLFLMGHELDFYRLAEKRYWAHLAYLATLQHTKIVGKHSRPGKLKSESDLCDSQLIHFATFGVKINNKRCPVIGITTGDKAEINTIKKIHEHRIAICKQTLIDLKRILDVEGWNVNETPGEIIVLSINKNNEINEGHRITFNAPFKQETENSIFDLH
ncbi:hypothetical protein E3J79_03155 [Candidatus Dependentiae bacterium]|nr:MAG: hypothetical protein E3J79_03155 [Candidatus Dependentiae bacterium]